jgi:hypothetical protein
METCPDETTLFSAPRNPLKCAVSNASTTGVNLARSPNHTNTAQQTPTDTTHSVTHTLTHTQAWHPPTATPNSHTLTLTHSHSHTHKLNDDFVHEIGLGLSGSLGAPGFSQNPRTAKSTRILFERPPARSIKNCVVCFLLFSKDPKHTRLVVLANTKHQTLGVPSCSQNNWVSRSINPSDFAPSKKLKETCPKLLKLSHSVLISTSCCR